MTAQQRDPEWDTYKATIVEAANKTGAELAGCGIEALRLLAAAHDVVFGVYQDRHEPDGVGMILIKGHQQMREVIAAGQAQTVSLTAIPCRSAEEAGAMRRVIGEEQALH